MIKSMKRGDLLLFKGRTNVWYERLICRATRGPYCHVEVAISTTSSIGAHPHGIMACMLDGSREVDVVPIAAPRIERGVTWALSQQGKAYGWLDIFYQGVKLLFPHNTFRFGEEGHFDCSDFATRCLIHAGVELPDSYLDTYTVSPNDLARFYKLIK